MKTVLPGGGFHEVPLVRHGGVEVRGPVSGPVPPAEEADVGIEEVTVEAGLVVVAGGDYRIPPTPGHFGGAGTGVAHL